MSAAAKTPSSQPFEVARPGGACAVCKRPIAMGDKMFAALLDASEGLQRVDTCTECWPAFDRAGVIAHWQTVMPAANAKKKVFVDDAILSELFVRLGDATDPAKVSFRFVLGLILMRKRLVVYESTRKDPGADAWVVRMKGSEEMLNLANPHLTEDQIKEVSTQLGEILSAEL